MNVPSWWETTLLALAAYRCWRLLAEDVILDHVRRRLVNLPFHWQDGEPLPAGYRNRLAEFINCGWCLGFWLSLLWWGAWQLWAHGTLVTAAVFAVSSVVGLVARLDRE